MKAKVAVHRIIGTPVLVHTAWEPTSDPDFGPHSTIMTGDFGSQHGQISTRRQPWTDKRSPDEFRREAVETERRAILLAKPWLRICGTLRDDGTVVEIAFDKDFAESIARLEPIVEVEL